MHIKKDAQSISLVSHGSKSTFQLIAFISPLIQSPTCCVVLQLERQEHASAACFFKCNMSTQKCIESEMNMKNDCWQQELQSQLANDLGAV